MTGRERRGEPAPPTLELGAGFRDDEVTVLLDGREAWHGSEVRTTDAVGLAAVLPLPAPASTLPVLEVRVGSRATVSARVDTSTGRLRCDLDPAGGGTITPVPRGSTAG